MVFDSLSKILFYYSVIIYAGLAESRETFESDSGTF